ncbi:MAG: phospholipase D-like domain-containing protein [Vicinamibacterales bacterium]
MSDDDLPFGLYQRLITRELEAKLLQFDPMRVVRRGVDEAEAHATLARHIQEVVARALRGLPAEERSGRQAEIANALVRTISDLAAAGGSVSHESWGGTVPILRESRPAASDVPDEVVTPPEELIEVRDAAGPALGSTPLPTPLVPLSASDLLVNARGEPGLARNLSMEIPSADSIDLLCAFVRSHGIRVLEDELAAHCKAGRTLRVLTTVYTGSTEQKALDWLVAHGAEVRVSYDTQSTRLHAKAWLFKRRTGFSTAYIGSSNLSKSALIDGQEWNVRLSEVTSPEILEKFEATFEQYWLSPEYQPYDPPRLQERNEPRIFDLHDPVGRTGLAAAGAARRRRDPDRGCLTSTGRPAATRRGLRAALARPGWAPATPWVPEVSPPVPAPTVVAPRGCWSSLYSR